MHTSQKDQAETVANIFQADKEIEVELQVSDKMDNFVQMGGKSGKVRAHFKSHKLWSKKHNHHAGAKLIVRYR